MNLLYIIYYSAESPISVLLQYAEKNIKFLLTKFNEKLHHQQVKRPGLSSQFKNQPLTPVNLAVIKSRYLRKLSFTGLFVALLMTAFGTGGLISDAHSTTYETALASQEDQSARYGIVNISAPRVQAYNDLYYFDVTVSDVAGNTRVPREVWLRATARENVYFLRSNYWARSNNGLDKVFRIYARLRALTSSGHLTVAISGVGSERLSQNSQHLARSIVLTPLRTDQIPRYGIVNITEPRLQSSNNLYYFEVTVSDVVSNNRPPRQLRLTVSDRENISYFTSNYSSWHSNGRDRVIRIFARLEVLTSTGHLTVSLSGIDNDRLSTDSTQLSRTISLAPLEAAQLPRYSIVSVTEPRIAANRGWYYRAQSRQSLYYFDVTVSDVVRSSRLPPQLRLTVSDRDNIGYVSTIYRNWHPNGRDQVFRIYTRLQVLTSSGHLTISLSGVDSEYLSPGQSSRVISFAPLQSAQTPRYGIVNISEPRIQTLRNSYYRGQTVDNLYYYFEVTVSDVISNTRPPWQLRLTVSDRENISYISTHNRYLSPDGRGYVYRVLARLQTLTSTGHLSIALGGLSDEYLSLDPDQSSRMISLAPLQADQIPRYGIVNVSEPRLQTYRLGYYRDQAADNLYYYFEVTVSDVVAATSAPWQLRLSVTDSENISQISSNYWQRGLNGRDRVFRVLVQLQALTSTGHLTFALSGVSNEHLSLNPSQLTRMVTLAPLESDRVPRYGIVEVTEPRIQTYGNRYYRWQADDDLYYYFEVTVSDVVDDTRPPVQLRLTVTDSENIDYLSTGDWFWSFNGRDRVFRVFARPQILTSTGHLTIALSGVDSERLSTSLGHSSRTISFAPLQADQVPGYGIVSVTEPRLQYNDLYYFEVTLSDVVASTRLPLQLGLTVTDSTNIDYVLSRYWTWHANGRDRVFRIYTRLQTVTSTGTLTIALSGVSNERLSSAHGHSSRTISLAPLRLGLVSLYGIIDVTEPRLQTYGNLYYFDVAVSDVVAATPVPRQLELVVTDPVNISYSASNYWTWGLNGRDRIFRVYARLQTATSTGGLTVSLSGIESARLSTSPAQTIRTVNLAPLISSSTPSFGIVDITPHNQDSKLYQQVLIRVSDYNRTTAVPEALTLRISDSVNIRRYEIFNTLRGLDRFFVLRVELQNSSAQANLTVSLTGIDEAQLNSQQRSRQVNFSPRQSYYYALLSTSSETATEDTEPVATEMAQALRLQEELQEGTPFIVLLSSPVRSQSAPSDTPWQFNIRIATVDSAILPAGLELRVETMVNFVGIKTTVRQRTSKVIDYLVEVLPDAQTHSGTIRFGISGLPESSQSTQSLTVTIESTLLEEIFTALEELKDSYDRSANIRFNRLLNEQTDIDNRLTAIIRAFAVALQNPVPRNIGDFDANGNGRLELADLRLIIRHNSGLRDDRKCGQSCRSLSESLSSEPTAAQQQRESGPIIVLESTPTQAQPKAPWRFVLLVGQSSLEQNLLPSDIRLITAARHRVRELTVTTENITATAIRYSVSARITSGNATAILYFSLTGSAASAKLKVVLKRPKLARATYRFKQLARERNQSQAISLTDLLVGVRAARESRLEKLDLNLQITRAVNSHDLEAFMASIESYDDESRNYDVNSDGTVDSYDFRLMVRHKAGLRGQMLCNQSCEDKIRVLLE